VGHQTNIFFPGEFPALFPGRAGGLGRLELTLTWTPQLSYQASVGSTCWCPRRTGNPKEWRLTQPKQSQQLVRENGCKPKPDLGKQEQTYAKGATYF